MDRAVMNYLVVSSEKAGKSMPLFVLDTLLAACPCGRWNTVWCAEYDEDHPGECCECFNERVAS